MALMEIKIYPDPVLRKKTEIIKEITPKIKELVLDLTETMLKKDGVGLAGPQVGISKKIISVLTDKGPAVFLNPKIIKSSGKKIKLQEGCLSLPGILVDVKRKNSIEIEAINIEGGKIKIKADGFQARIFQHEIDHLNGKLIIDKLGLLKRIKAKKQFK
jgi:peptide deformylase